MPTIADPLPGQLTTENWMQTRKDLLGRYIGTPDGRGKVLKAMLWPLKDSVAYASRDEAVEADKERVASLVVQTDALLGLVTGDEAPDGMGTLLDEARVLAGDVQADPRGVELAEWMKTTLEQKAEHLS